jgi:hypothetical protein
VTPDLSGRKRFLRARAVLRLRPKDVARPVVMLLRRIGWSLWVALAAAWLIAAQPLLGAAALAAAPGAALSGAVICGTNAPRENRSDHAHPPGCCLIGCPMCAPLAAPPFIAGLDARQPMPMAPSAVDADDGLILAPERNQRQPRAPPQTA